jgi:branched-chain amino acid transport system substrate-binding protein
MNKMTRRALPAIAGLATAAFAMLGGPALADDTVTIHLMSPFSGPVAFYGEGYRDGLKLAFDEIGNKVNGHELKIVEEDDECTPENAVSQVNKIIDSAVIVVGPGCTGSMLAVQKTLAEAQIPHIFTGYGAAVGQKGDEYVFAASISDGLMAERMIKWAKEKFGIESWGLLHDTSGYGASGANTFKKAAEAAGVKVTGEASFNPGEREFTGLLLNVDKTKPDALHMIAYEVELGLMVKQARQAGLKEQIIGPPGFVNPEMAEAAGTAAEGLHFMSIILPDDPDPAVQSFVANFKKTYNASPKDVNAIGYVAGLMVIDALKHIDGEVTKEALTAALRKTDIAASPLGPVKFDDKGERTGDKLVVIGVIKNGKASFVTRL